MTGSGSLETDGLLYTSVATFDEVVMGGDKIVEAVDPLRFCKEVEVVWVRKYLLRQLSIIVAKLSSPFSPSSVRF